MNKRKIEDVMTEIAEAVEGEVRLDYSGRGMFGETCVGIDCDNVNECIAEAAMHGIRRAQVDNMGKGYIVYFPHLKKGQMK